MYPPIRCNCGFPLGEFYPAFRVALRAKFGNIKIDLSKMAASGDTVVCADILDDLKIENPCCRLAMMCRAIFHNYR